MPNAYVRMHATGCGFAANHTACNEETVQRMRNEESVNRKLFVLMPHFYYILFGYMLQTTFNA